MVPLHVINVSIDYLAYEHQEHYYSKYIDWYIEKVIYDEVVLIKDCVYKRTIKRKEKW